MIDYLQKFRLDDKTAFIVGGLGLIGKDVATAFAIAGAKVVVLDIDKEGGENLSKNMNDNNYRIHFELFNSSEMKKIEKNFSDIITKYGCPDIFINCSYPRNNDWAKSSFQNIELESYRENVDIHMNSFVWLARMSAESMKKEKKNGSIIQLGSIYGIAGQDLTIYEDTNMEENMTYSVIKGGITNFTRQMASYYGQYNIRINTLTPGGLLGHVAGKSNDQNPVFINQYSKRVPLKRLGKSEEIASSALFLASDAASYITGTTLIVDGGWTAI